MESSTSLGINFFLHEKMKGVGPDLDDPQGISSSGIGIPWTCERPAHGW